MGLTTIIGDNETHHVMISKQATKHSFQGFSAANAAIFVKNGAGGEPLEKFWRIAKVIADSLRT